MSVKLTMTVETTDRMAPAIEQHLLKQAEGLGARLTRVEYDDQGDYRLEARRKTLRKIGRAK